MSCSNSVFPNNENSIQEQFRLGTFDREHILVYTGLQNIFAHNNMRYTFPSNTVFLNLHNVNYKNKKATQQKLAF